MRPDEPITEPLFIPRPRTESRAVQADHRLVEAARHGHLPVEDQDPLIRLLTALHDARAASGRA